MDTPLTLRDLSLLGFLVESGGQNYWKVQTPDDEIAFFHPVFIEDKANKQDALRAQRKAARIEEELLQSGGKINAAFPASGEKLTPLIIAPKATPDAERAALEGTISLFTASPYRLIYRQKIWGESQRRLVSPRKKITWTQAAIIRMSILSSEPLTQLEISDTLGLSQAAIAKATKSLYEKHNISLGPQRRENSKNLLSFLERAYPSNLVINTYWKSSGPLLDQAKQTIKAYSHQQLWSLITGEVAADYYAAWKIPETAELYAEGPLDLENYGFLEVDPESSTLQVKIVKDPTLIATARWWCNYTYQSELLYVDPVATYIDMHRSDSSDTREGSEKLLTAIDRKKI